MAISRSTYGTRRLAIVLFARLLVALFLLPSQSQRLLQYVGGPLRSSPQSSTRRVFPWITALPNMWNGYVAPCRRCMRKIASFIATLSY